MPANVMPRPFLPGCGGPTIPSSDSRNTASMLTRPNTPISWSTAICDCSINSTIGSRACPLRAKK
jgi:hypothetical protein